MQAAVGKGGPLEKWSVVGGRWSVVKPLSPGIGRVGSKLMFWSPKAAETPYQALERQKGLLDAKLAAARAKVKEQDDYMRELVASRNYVQSVY